MTTPSPREIEHEIQQLKPPDEADDSPPPIDRLRKAWIPHDGGQRDVLDASARFKIVACGRRWGKTELAAFTALEYALTNDGSLVWWVAPNYNQADVGFQTVRRVLPESVGRDLTRTEPKAIRFSNAAEISFRSADHPDTLRGVGLDYLVLDEAAWVMAEAWHEALRPTLADTGGGMMAISTPKARNWFYKVFQRGQEPDEFDAYQSFQYPTEQNPHIPPDEIDEARESIPDRAFRQEYLAEFTPGGGAVFSALENVLEDYDYREADPEGRCRTGVDFARHQDHTAIVTLDENGRLVHLDHIRGGGWPQIQAAVERGYDRYGGVCRLDATRDNKIVADLEAAGVDVDPVTFSPVKKTEMVEDLITAVENGELALPADLDVVVRELELYEYEVTPAGNVRYSAPPGFHDDCVDALALAVSAPGSTGGWSRSDHSLGSLTSAGWGR